MARRATYTPEQRRTIAAIDRIGREVGASPKEKKAAYETARVEANFGNPGGGDADSAGWRQERASLYKDPQNLTASVRRFFGETKAVKDKYGKAGDLAAAVQRPAAQYRGRYQEHSAEADALLGGHHSSGPVQGSASEVDGEEYTKAKRRAIVGQLLAKHNPHSILLKTGVATTETPSRDDFLKTVAHTRSRAGSTPAASGGGGLGHGLDGAVHSLERLTGLPVTARQEPGHAAGGDHDPAVKGATARDFGGSEAARKAAFTKLTRQLGVKGATYKGADINVVKNGIRYQVISRDHGTGPHLHVGMRKVG